MASAGSVFIADSCIGGLSVVKSLWRAGVAGEAIFLADYAINPLGVKDEAAIAGVVDRWLGLAEEHSDTLIIACNTLSIRHRYLSQSGELHSGLRQVVSMVDCFQEMVEIEAERLTNKRVLVIGTEYTASQPLHLEILRAAVPGVRATAVAATDLERKVARFQPGPVTLSDELHQAIRSADVVVLACTCFPLVQDELEALYPEPIFLDPGAYCSSILDSTSQTGEKKLRMDVTGNSVAMEQVMNFASTCLDVRGSEGVITCFT